VAGQNGRVSILEGAMTGKPSFTNANLDRVVRTTYKSPPALRLISTRHINTTELASMLKRPWLDRKKLGLRWQQYRQELRRQKHWWLRPHSSYQPFFILATCRSGSNLLLDYLRQLPGVAGHSEVLCPLLAIGPTRAHLPVRQAVRHIRLSLQTKRLPIRGCKLMLHQLANCQVKMEHLDDAFPSARYLVLYRQSLAEQFVSLRLAETTQQWFLKPGEQQKQPRIVIQPAELRWYCDWIRAGYQNVLGHPGLAERSAILSYEELTTDPVRCLRDSICPLLELPETQIQTQLRKQNTKGFAERVANYADVKDLLDGPQCQQRYAWPDSRRNAAA
jgi:LPS sulfotransferase NodH